jgi:hypothetical protein
VRLNCTGREADKPVVVVKLWQVLALTAAAALLAGILFGRYAVPAGGGPKGIRVDLGNGRGAIYVPDKSAYNELKQRSNESDAQANVRAAVPGLEAYNADHGVGYDGVTLTKLQQSYDSGIKDVTIVRASASSYCVQSTVGSTTYHKEGPAGDIVSGPCP